MKLPQTSLVTLFTVERHVTPLHTLKCFLYAETVERNSLYLRSLNVSSFTAGVQMNAKVSKTLITKLYKLAAPCSGSYFLLLTGLFALMERAKCYGCGFKTYHFRACA